MKAQTAAKTMGEPSKNSSRLLKNCVGLASDLDFDSAGRLGSDCQPSFDLHIGELAIVFRRATLAVREFQETIRQHSSLDF